MTRLLALAGVALLLIASPALAQDDSVAVRMDDSVAVRMTVAAYHAALQSGDSATALSLLAPDVVVLESGGIESRSEYRANHLSADMAFAQATRSVRSPGPVRVEGDVAWASATSETRGEWNGNPVASAGAELMVLRRTAAGWRITAIHWSSRRLRD